VNIPVIASGGCGTPEHIYDAFAVGKADAALAASIFHYKEYPVGDVKKYLKERGIPVRL
jgi:cyclase